MQIHVAKTTAQMAVDNLDRSGNYDDPVLAEIYDQCEIGTEDVELLRRLLRGYGPLNILECFSGTGRILIPLACDGHGITGIEIAEAMNARAASKLAALGKEVRDRVTLVTGDVLEDEWGEGYDVVVLGANCLFELGSAEAQEECIRRASEALRPGGHVYVDNEDAGGVDPSDAGTGWTALQGTTAGGTYAKWSARVVDVDVAAGVAHLIRTRYQRSPDWTETTVECAARKRPVGGDEAEAWLCKYGFEVLKKFADRKGTPYAKGRSGRAIFWARTGDLVATTV